MACPQMQRREIELKNKTIISISKVGSELN
jgi:hypothetical protein